MTRILLTVALLFAASTLHAAIASRTFAITGWSCEGCARKTVSVVKRVPGVKDARADLASGKLVLTVDDAAFDAAAARTAIERLGYGAR